MPEPDTQDFHASLTLGTVFRYPHTSVFLTEFLNIFSIFFCAGASLKSSANKMIIAEYEFYP